MKRILPLFALFVSPHLYSQSSVSTATPATANIGGGYAIINPDFLLDWSIGGASSIDTYYGGNPFSNSLFGAEWSITSGILQPFDKNALIFNPLIPNWTREEVRVFPVPSDGNVTIDFRSPVTGKISIQLLNANGNLMGTREFTQQNSPSTQSWNFTQSPSGMYYFRILLTGEQGKVLKKGLFKVEKIK